MCVCASDSEMYLFCVVVIDARKMQININDIIDPSMMYYDRLQREREKNDGCLNGRVLFVVISL